jgi:hydroxyacylglutathione hydrolase
MKALTLEEFITLTNDKALIIDFRIPDIFEYGFVPNSINIGINGDPDKWLKALVQADRKIVCIFPEGKESYCENILLDNGFTNVAGFLLGGFKTWEKSKNPIDMVISITPEEILLDIKFLKETEKIIDLRTESEIKSGKLPDALFIELQQLSSMLTELDPEHTFYLYCSGGYRSMIAASILKYHGYKWVKNIYGGFTRIQAEMGKINPK